MMIPKIIAFLSDFGTQDWFAGEMKAIMLGISPQSTIIDITHQIKPGDTRSAAFMLLATYKSFPEQTVFCLSIDSTFESKPPLLAYADNYLFVAPDNGVLSWVLGRVPAKIWHIENDNYFRKPYSQTFRARDVYGPAAAHLSNGSSPENFGRPVSEIFTIAFPQAVISPQVKIESEIIYIDRFGNAVTTIEPHHLASLHQPSTVRILKNGLQLPLRNYYCEVDKNYGLGYIGSAGFIEIGVNEGNASVQFDLNIGDKVELY